MSKQIGAKITCPNCQTQFDVTLYRSIWGEYAANRELVMSDEINVVTCPKCNISNKLEFPFIYTNAKQHFAVWWEPEYDPQIDKDSQEYEKMLGPGNYFTTAPRIKNWGEFKATIVKYETGELKGNPGRMSTQMQGQIKGFLNHFQEKSKKKKKGCFAFIIFIALAFTLTSSLFL